MKINKVLFQKMQNAFLISISVLYRSKRKQAIIAAGNNYQLSANYFQVLLINGSKNYFIDHIQSKFILTILVGKK
jgi:hypothetical protein